MPMIDTILSVIPVSGSFVIDQEPILQFLTIQWDDSPSEPYQKS